MVAVAEVAVVAGSPDLPPKIKTKLVIFGITGDLSKRKLLPALRKIVKSQAVDNLEIIGVSRSSLNIRTLVGKQLEEISRGITMDISNIDDYRKLKKEILPKVGEQTLIYLSVPPSASTRIADNLGEVRINNPRVKLLFEKPFGLDLASSEDMVERTSRYFNEAQIYRIDHYLAKEMVQNIVAFRSGNAMFRHLWGNRAVERIEIRAFETLGIAGRAQFYEQTGALRDVVQGHLMQLLALVLMDIPSTLNWDQLSDLRLQALRRVSSANPELAVRAQYDSYKNEVDSSSSQVETFVKVDLFSDSLMWENIPLTLVTGKALDRKVTEIVVYFKTGHVDQSNALRFKIQPDEGIEIDLFVKSPGYERVYERQKLQYKYPEDASLPEAYEQVLVDAIRSRKSLFTSSQEILESWRILQPVLSSWSLDDRPIAIYRSGSTAQEVIDGK